MTPAQDENSSRGIVPCTLYSGHYHFGVGGLANSLYRNGFRGTMCIGYIPPLPPWARLAQRDSEDMVLQVSEDFRLRFIEWRTERHLCYEKSRFMQHVFDQVAPDCESVLLFDADITIHGSWNFFEAWLDQGVALCLDACFPIVPARHPWRAAWRTLAKDAGYDSFRDLDFYFNSGFIGVPRSERAVLECWNALIDTIMKKRGSPIPAMGLNPQESAFGRDDQDSLNCALMATSVHLSIIGQEGMDFVKAGYTMSHAVSRTKPWRMHYIAQALDARPPSEADKNFWQYTDQPIHLFSGMRIALTRWAIRLASVMGHFNNRYRT
jgi:hypothetical protein